MDLEAAGPETRGLEAVSEGMLTPRALVSFCKMAITPPPHALAMHVHHHHPPDSHMSVGEESIGWCC